MKIFVILTIAEGKPTINFAQNKLAMEFQLSEEQLMIQKAARDFAQQDCLPGVIERDEKQLFPKYGKNSRVVIYLTQILPESFYQTHEKTSFSVTV